MGGGKCRHLHPSIPGSDYRSNLGRFGESLASQEATLAQGALGILPKQPASFTKNTWGVSIRRVVARGPRQKGQNQLVLVVWVSFLGCGILIFSEPTWRKINNFFPGDSRSEKFASRFFFFAFFRCFGLLPKTGTEQFGVEAKLKLPRSTQNDVGG